MFTLDAKRAYSTRGRGDVRLSLLSTRVHEHARLAIVRLAQQRGMSVSEYLCRLLNDHLQACGAATFRDVRTR